VADRLSKNAEAKKRKKDAGYGLSKRCQRTRRRESRNGEKYDAKSFSGKWLFRHFSQRRNSHKLISSIAGPIGYGPAFLFLKASTTTSQHT